MDINFELYKIFYQAATAASFSEAATKLYISQSAVSQAIKNLEEKLGVQLFLRQTRHLKLTREGELLLTHIEQAYNFIKVAEMKIAEIQNLERGEIRIGASDTVCKYFLLPFLEQFSCCYPKIKIQFLNRTSPQIIEALKNGVIDFGIVTLPVTAENLEVSELTTVTDIFVATDKFAGLNRGNITWEELAGYPILLLEKNSATRRNLDHFLQQQGIEMIPEIELENVDLLVEFAKIGLGIAHVMKECVLDDLSQGRLFAVKTPAELPPRRLGLITHQNVPLSQATRKFIEQLHLGLQ
jgi:DNA-binding transcriptional LysR family regulator